MPTKYQCPGVYVEEDASLALAVTSGATAVPVLAHDSRLISQDNPVRIDSWLKFIKRTEVTNKTAQELKGDKLYVSLKTYFDNGGGYCYLCKVEQLATAVPNMDDVTLIVQAGTSLGQFQRAMNDGQLIGNGKSRFAILDGPSEIGSDAGTAMNSYTNTSHAAVYFPILNAEWAKVDVDYTDIPVSAAVAGVYCSTDRDRGVWKAPANVILRGGVRPKVAVSDAAQGDYNTGSKPLNMIREFVSGTPIVWGARTLAAAGSEADRWRYVPVRRLFSAAEKDIERAMAFAVFEPNNQPTWEKVRAAIDNYLHALWRAGGLMGTKPEQAYFVHVGFGLTMSQEDIDRGKMIVKVGMAPVFPTEFIVLRFTQDMVSA